MTNFKGKAIYQPAGKAAEYAKWACNFYTGCSNGCTYCYLKKGRGAKILGGDKPTLKKCFKDETHALEVFEKELMQNLQELQKHGIFFSFSTDPMLPETVGLTKDAIGISVKHKVPVKILTKRVDSIHKIFEDENKAYEKVKFMAFSKLIAFGFTLTGHDELEPGASTNQERIEAMKKLHDAGFKTFASIEPVIDFNSSGLMIYEISGYCDLINVGLESGKKYDKKELRSFIDWCNLMFPHHAKEGCIILNIYYFKDSLLKAVGIERSDLPTNCVTSDYNMFCGLPVWPSCEDTTQ